MTDINCVTVFGRVAREPNYSTTTNGNGCLKWAIAVNESKRQGTEWKDDVSFFDIRTYGENCDKLAKRLTKGSKVCLSGRLRQERWEKDGQTRVNVVIISSSLEIVEAKETQTSEKAEEPKPKKGGPESFQEAPPFDDLPF